MVPWGDILRKPKQMIPPLLIKFVKRSCYAMLTMAISVQLVIAANVKAQSLAEIKVSINIQNQQDLKTTLLQLKEKTGFQLIYNENVISGIKSKSIQIKNVAATTALNKLLQNTGLSYLVEGKKIVIYTNGENETQQSYIRGKVTDETGYPMPGATVSVVELKKTVLANSEGAFAIEVSPGTYTLTVNHIGYQPETLKGIKANTVNLVVKLIPQTQNLENVVVTALGIKREEKSLGYAITKVDGQEISKTSPGNWINALSGKVPGLNITKAGAGPGGTVRITLRGQNSLDLDKGEPLLVIDGVPVNSGIIGNNGISYGATGNTETPVDYGNGLSEINPDDIKEVVILRGPSAAALYGSRAASGAILITTKSNTDTKGRFTAAFNSSVTLDQVLHYPDFQFDYGLGAGTAKYYSFGASADGANTHTSRSWGPKFEGQQYFQYDPATQLQGKQRTPWLADKNYTKDAFKTGVTYNNTLSLSGGDSKNSIRLSYNDQRNEYILPNTGYAFNRVTFSSNSVLNKFQLTTRVNYYHKSSDNLPLSGYNSNTYMYAIMYGAPNIPFNWQQNYWLPGQEGVAQSNKLNSAIDNPYFMLYENLNTLNNDRIFGNITASYAFNKKMKLQLRGGIDQSTSFRTTRRPYSSERFATGRYQEQNVNVKEQNYDFLYKYDEKLFKNIGISLSAGGSSTIQESQNTNITAEQLSYPALYTLANSTDRPLLVSQRLKKVVNSVYGLMQFNYKSSLFLDLTGRNDWSSALPKVNNSYFYYSVSGSAVLTEMFDLSAVKPLSFLKLRASVAQVGNDTDPYRTSLYYSNTDFGGSYRNPTTLPGGDNLKPEIITNREFGADVRFFKNRLSFDITYYNSDSKNQILEVPNDPSTGYQYRVFNAGLIKNSGWETAVTGNILSPGSKLKWRTTLTWSKNKSQIKALADGVESIIMATGPRGFIEARVGGAIGDIYGSGYLRTPDGQIVYDASGYPIIDTENIKYIGSAIADWKGGIQNQVSYKNWSLSFLFDGQKGGQVYSFSNSVLAGNGKLKSTLPGRETGIVGEGVQRNADGTYRKNDVVADAAGYYNAMYLRDNMEANTLDVSYIKLREATLEYQFTDKFIKKIKFLRGASFSIYGRDLLLFTKFPLYDPEIATINRNRIEPGFETGQFPSTRSFGAMLKASF